MSSARPRSSSIVITISTLALFLVPWTQSRADFDSGREAYLIGDYARAFELFLPSALQGNAKSQIGIGLLLARGHGTATDIVRSYFWFDRATTGSAGEHVVVRILARANRDYLGKRMTASELSKAKLWSIMIAASAELLEGTPIIGHRRGLARSGPEGAAAAFRIAGGARPELVGRMAADGASATAQRAVAYQIQLAALRKGQSRELRAIWQRLSKRYSSLTEFQPVLVRLNLGDAGVYEALRAGPFDDARNAYKTCSSLIADEQDCLVLAN